MSGQRANGASKETTRRNSVDMTLLQSLQLKPASSWAQLDTAEITSANTAAATYDQAPSVPRRHESGECHRQWDISPPPPPKPKSNGTIDTRPTRPRRNISAEISSHGSLAFSSEDDDTEDGATVGSSKDPPVELQQFMTIPSTDGKEDENPEKEPDCEPVRSCPSKFSMPEDIKEENPSAATSPRTPCPSVDDVPLPNKSHPTPALTRGMPRRRSNVMLSMKLQKSLKGSNLTKLLQDEGTSQPIQPARTKEPPSLVIPSPKRLSLPVTIEEERDLIASSASNSSSKHPNSMSIPRLPSLSSRKRLSLPEAKLESSMRRKLPKMSSLSSLTSSWRSRTMAAENRRRLGEKRDVDAAEDSVVTRPPIITDDLLVTKNGVAAAPLPGASLSGDDGNSSSTIKTNHLALTQTIITPRIPGNDGAKTLVELPDGSRVSIAELTRLLMDSLPRHEATSVAGDGRPYYFFHGSEGLDVMRKLFFQTAPDDDAAVISFGMALEGSDFGHLIHNMTPNVEYKDAVLVLQPLLKPHVLNSLIDLKTNNAASTKRPGYKTPELKATQIMLELSMLMDQIFVAASDGVTKSFNQRLVRKFEESVVYLQLVNIRFRSSDERVAFTVNLYNCMMRHALVIRNRAKYLPSWPQQHNDLHEFMSNIQYNIGGKLVSLLDVHVSLLENIDITKIFVDGKDKHKVATGRRPPSRPWWRKMLLSGILGCRQKASASSAQKQTPTTDSRIIFCITFGTTSSPQVRTIDPCYLERDLQYAAQSFCEQHITVRIIKQKGCTIKIPQLLDWYASKLGATGSNKDNIMEKLVRFLSPDQIKKLNTFSGNHPNSKWKIRFQKHNWDIPETPLPPLQLPLPALREQNNSEALSQRLSLTSEPLEGVTLTFPEPRSRRNQHQAPDQDDSKSLFSEITMESELVGMSTKGFHFQSRRGPMTVASHPNQA